MRQSGGNPKHPLNPCEARHLKRPSRQIPTRAHTYIQPNRRFRLPRAGTQAFLVPRPTSYRNCAAKISTRQHPTRLIIVSSALPHIQSSARSSPAQLSFALAAHSRRRPALLPKHANLGRCCRRHPQWPGHSGPGQRPPKRQHLPDRPNPKRMHPVRIFQLSHLFHLRGRSANTLHLRRGLPPRKRGQLAYL